MNEPTASSTTPEGEKTALLLQKVRVGDQRAKNALIRRYIPILERWARGRLPGYARDMADTMDIVQITLIRVLERVDEFEPTREGAFLAYLRRAIMNQIRNEIRRVSRRPARGELIDDVSATGDRTPLEEVIGRDALDRYERALTTLTEEQQEGVILRLEFGFTHEQVAEALGKNTVSAARMLVNRAVDRLKEVMREQEDETE
jgi:RNA polymerase sigma-70 factor (ECF subfamily)